MNELYIVLSCLIAVSVISQMIIRKVESKRYEEYLHQQDLAIDQLRSNLIDARFRLTALELETRLNEK